MGEGPLQIWACGSGCSRNYLTVPYLGQEGAPEDAASIKVSEVDTRGVDVYGEEALPLQDRRLRVRRACQRLRTSS